MSAPVWLCSELHEHYPVMWNQGHNHNSEFYKVDRILHDPRLNGGQEIHVIFC